MKALFEVFEDYAADYQKRHRYRGRSGMVHMHSIEGGWPYRCNRVPIFCHAFMEFRILPHETMRDVPIEVERLANMARAVNPDVKFDVEYFVSLPSASVPEDTEIAKQVREAHALVEDRTPEEHMGLFFSDAAHLLAYGVPAVNYGPSGRTISGKANWDPLIGEHTSIEDIVGTARTYVAIMLEAGSRSRAELGPPRLTGESSARAGTCVPVHLMNRWRKLLLPRRDAGATIESFRCWRSRRGREGPLRDQDNEHEPHPDRISTGIRTRAGNAACLLPADGHDARSCESVCRGTRPVP